MSLLGSLRQWLRPRKKMPTRSTRSLAVETLEDRLVLSTFAEVEPNNTIATANIVNIATGDIVTTKPADWLIISGSIAAGADSDYYQFTINNPSGVFFDIDSRDTGLSTTLNSTLAVFDSTGAAVPNGTNNDGYDFQGFNVPTSSVPSATSFDSSLYLDLKAGTYTVRVNGFGATTGNYQLKLLADSNYTTTPPVLNSLPGAADTLYLDFTGHSSTNDAWTTNVPTAGGAAHGPYTAAPYDFNGDTAHFTPAERLAMYNVWRITSEDYSPFKLNVSTVQPANFNNGVAFRMIVTSSDASIIGYDPSTNLGITFLDSYASGTNDNVSFTFANTFANYGGGISGMIMARPVEQGNTASHEFGHALGLEHYASSAGSAGSADVLPNAIMATPDIGLNRETWATGINEPGNSQDDMAVISNATNTFGYRTDDYGNTTAAASSATPAPGGYFNNGVLERVTDKDVFKFTAFGATTIAATVDDYVTNLDLELRLFDSTGTQIAIDTPSDSTSAKIVMPSLAKGTYYVDVRGAGLAGEAGTYALKIDTVLTTVTLDAHVVTVTDIASSGKADNLTISVDGSNFRINDPDNALSAGAGVTQIDANTVEVPMSDATGPNSIAVNTLGGNDKLTLDFTNAIATSIHGLTFNGGAGSDTLFGNFFDNTWNITGANAGNIAGTAIRFTNTENLTGNIANDVFRFIGVNASLSGKLDGGDGTNHLDYSAVGPVAVNLKTGVASRVAGGILHFNLVIGSAAGHSRLVGSDAGSLLLGKGTGNTLIGGAGRNVLIGGMGINTIIGGPSDDLIINGRTVFEDLPPSLEIILGIWQLTTMTYAERIAYFQTSTSTSTRLSVSEGTVILAKGLSNVGLGPRLGTGNFIYQSTIYGKGGNDWFITKYPVTVLDRQPGEVLTTH